MTFGRGSAVRPDAGRWLVFGLGNPGRKYARTPHSIGLESVAQLAADLQVPRRKKTYKAVWGVWHTHMSPLAGEGDVPNSASVLLATPQVYMNLNGFSVQRLMQAERVKPSQLLVVHDHLDLPLGRIRLRARGGSGGNRGVESVIAQLGTREFHRLSVGVGRPPGRMDATAYVLRPWNAGTEQEAVVPLRSLVGEAIVYWFRHGLEQAMNRYNGVP